MERLQALGREVRHRCANLRKLGKRYSKRQQVAGIGRLEGDATQQTLEIENAFHGTPQLFARDQVADHRSNGLQSSIDLGEVNRRPQHPRAQQSLAHRCYRAIEATEKRRALARAGE